MLSPKEILDKYDVEIISETIDEYVCKCPFHEDSTPSFSINKQTGLYLCFTCDSQGLECGRGNLVCCVKYLAECSYKKAKEILKENEDPDSVLQSIKKQLSKIKNKRIVMKEEAEELKAIGLPNTYSQLYELEKCPRYLKSRLHWQTIKHFQLGMGFGGTYNNRIIIPIKYNGINYGYQARKTNDYDDDKKYLFAYGFKIKNFLFNYDGAKEYRKIILVEGVFDAMSMWEKGFPNTVATFGAKEIKGKQLKLLVEGEFEEVILCFDSDPNMVGQIAAKRNVKKLKNFFTISRMKLPIDKDPNDLTKNELKKLFKFRKCYDLFNNQSQVIKRKIENGRNS